MSDQENPIPDHECIGEDCPHPEALVIRLVATDDGSIDTQFGVHKLSITQIIAAMVQLLDGLAQDSRPDGIPPMVAFARMREEIRKSVEATDPPPDVSQAIAELADGGDE